MFFQRLVIILVISIASISSARAAFIDSFESGKYDESFRLAYSKALNGDASAQYVVGRILYEGLGSASRDVDLAKKFIDDSIDQGNGRAAKYIGEQLSKEGAEKSSRCKGLDYLKKAESLGERGLGKTILSLSKVCEGELSKQACSRYNKNDKKLAATIARCIARGHIKGDAEVYWVRSFQQGNAASLVEAAKIYLDPKSAKINIEQIVQHIPKFYEKATNKTRERMSKIIFGFGYSSASCESGKDAFGFEKQGDTSGCVLAAAAGDANACQFAAMWWRSGQNGLQANPVYADKLLKECVDTSNPENFDLALHLKSLEGQPKTHFKTAIDFFQKDEFVFGDVVGAALNLEMKLFVAGNITTFASKPEDVPMLFVAVDWNAQDPETIAQSLNLIETKYFDQEIFKQSAVTDNIGKLDFSEDWAARLHSLNADFSKKIVNRYIQNGDCKAFMYALENAGRHDGEIVSQSVMDKCARDLINPNEGLDWKFETSKSCAFVMQKLMTPGPVDQLCPYFAEYLLHRDVCKASDQGQVPNLIADEPATIEQCKFIDSTVARVESERLIRDIWKRSRQKTPGWNQGNTFKPIVTEAFNLAAFSCSANDGYGCGLAAFILKDFGKFTDQKPEASSSSDQQQSTNVFYGKKAKEYAEIGFSLESDEAAGVYLDLSDLNSIKKSKSKTQAQEVLRELLEKGSNPAKVREASVCIDKGAIGDFASGIGSIFGGGDECALACRNLRKIIRDKGLDIMSLARAEKLLNMQACK